MAMEAINSRTNQKCAANKVGKALIFFDEKVLICVIVCNFISLFDAFKRFSCHVSSDEEHF